jgi:RecA-family ATPase
VAAAAGLYFCGLPITKLPVYGLFCEDTTTEVVRRAGKIAQFYNVGFSGFTNFHFASLVGVMDSELLSFAHDGYKFGPAYELLSNQLTELRPGLVVLDTLPDFFGGEEINRRQTSIFIRMLDALSIRFECAIVCAAHPSMRGRSSGRFDSGNTGIEGKMRARLSLHDPGDEDADDDEPPEERARRIAVNPSDKRILTRQNSNYAKPGETIELLIQDGFFTPAALDPNNQSGPRRALAARAKFLECLRAIKQEGRYVHDMPNNPARYAPKVFRSHPLNRDTKFAVREFEVAMRDLLADTPQRIGLQMTGQTGKKHAEFYEL